MKKRLNGISKITGMIFGYGIMLCLFAGGLTFFGFLVAIIAGGEIAAEICSIIYKGIFPVIIKTTNILVLVGLLHMYIKGEVSLTISNRKGK